MTTTFELVGPGAAEEVLDVVRAAFGARPALDPPADAAGETVESVRTRLATGGGLLARLDGEPTGALLFDKVGDTVFLRRFGVVPQAQGRGVAAALVERAVEVAADLGGAAVAVVAREELPETVRFWERRGFAPVLTISPYVELRRRLPWLVRASDADAMRAVGARLAEQLRAGDVVLLIGDLGAGKTTLTQGLGEALGARGPFASPTFVIARTHPSLVGGPALVHADAYRLGGLGELDDLDLEESLDEAVTVVEWGEGIAEGLAESRLEVRIARSGSADDETRTVAVTAVGPRWQGVSW